jgi:phosphoribosylformylglycinamidine synthase
MKPRCFEVSIRPDLPDPLGDQIRHILADFQIGPVESVRTTRLFTIWLSDEHGGDPQVDERIARELLTDPVCEQYTIRGSKTANPHPADALLVQVHLKPGVMDNVADSAKLALADMGIPVAEVATARRYEIRPILNHSDLARLPRLLGNECVEEVVIGTKPLGPPPTPPRYEFKLQHVAIRDLADAELEKLSRQGHLFLSIEEMRTIQNHYRTLGRDPTDLELETLAQTWSEHCIHKTMRSAVDYKGAPFPSSGNAARGPFTTTYSNLLKDTIARATDELIHERRGPDCLSVFKDNAGIIAFDDHYAVAFKVETHNHPSAIEPYGGSATGVGGVIRDILGCGLGAKPIADTDIFCVAPPDWPIDAVPKGVIHPKSILKGIVAGVRDYGNRMGIPTVNGAIYFDPRYLGNPLVYCGCIGLIPRNRIDKAARPGDAIVLLGGRTGRDGIHGATFSSAELTDKHEDEFAHAVQIGNPIEEKKILDVILQARDYPISPAGQAQPASHVSPIGRVLPAANTADTRCLYSAMTDCGAGGLSSAVGEMAAEIGGEVNLETVPLKYAGLRYAEIWISEAQERMVLAVPQEDLATLLALAASEDVEATIIGRFTDTRRLIIRYKGTEVGNLDLEFLHNGVPKTSRRAEWWPEAPAPASALDPNRDRQGAAHTASDQSPPDPNRDRKGADTHVSPPDPSRDRKGAVPLHPPSLTDALRRRLADPTTASKHWLIRQYDHEVQGASVIKPLAGPRHGPSDAAVLRPRLDSRRGIAIGCGLAPQLADADPYWMAVAAIDEALRNVICVGGDPAKTAILDNFCWPRADDPRNLGALVRACQACYDVAKAYGLPFISGKDSLNNVFALDPADVDMVRRTIAQQTGTAPPLTGGRLAIPYTLLISAVSLIDDVTKCCSMDLKQNESQLYLIGQPTTFDHDAESSRPRFDLALAAETHRTVAKLISEGLVSAVHDVSDGGLAVAVAEMCIAADRSCRLHAFAESARAHDAAHCLPNLAAGSDGDDSDIFFADSATLYVVEVVNERHDEFIRMTAAVPSRQIALTPATPPGSEPTFEIATRFGPQPIPLATLRAAWQAPLDW